jgi:arylsulfatase A-like enzyme
MFNTYEETINVPLVLSNPALFEHRVETDALASLVDLVPTLLTLGGGDAPDDLRGHHLAPIMAPAPTPDAELMGRAGIDLSPVLEHPAPAPGVQDAIHFTYDDHQAATATQDAPGQPNRIRAIRTRGAKYAFYFDPSGEAATEYELYDLQRDPLEVENLLGVRTGEPTSPAAAKLHAELSEQLDEAMRRCRTEPGRLTSAA